MEKHQTLARKYRPKQLNDLVGQETLVKALRSAFQQNNVPQALLLCGTRGVGKTTTARIVATCMNCKGTDGMRSGIMSEACYQCASCKSIIDGNHMDVVEIDAASHTGVDDMREIIESIKYKAIQGKYKIFIIDEVHMLSKSAFNALLKTLEEPPSHVRFIFATTELQKIPQTILSRCIRFDLKLIEVKDIILQLENILQKENVTFTTDALAILARAAQGSMRDALSLADQARLVGNGDINNSDLQAMLGLSKREHLFTILRLLFSNEANEALEFLQKLESEGADPLRLCEEISDIIYWLVCIKKLPALLNDNTWPEADRLLATEIVKTIGIDKLLQAWDLTLKTYDDVRNGPYPTQALHVGLLRICFVHEVLKNDGGNSTGDHGGNQGSLSSNNFSTEKAAKETKQSFSQDIINSFSDLLALTLKSKEGMLYTHLVYDVCVKTFNNQHIILNYADRVPKTFTNDLQRFLEMKTAKKWLVQREESFFGETFNQKQQEILKLLEKKAREHPVVAEILQVLPEATMTIH